MAQFGNEDNKSDFCDHIAVRLNRVEKTLKGGKSLIMMTSAEQKV